MLHPIKELAFTECHTNIAYNELRNAHRRLLGISRNQSLCVKARACAARDAKKIKRIIRELKRIG